MPDGPTGRFFTLSLCGDVGSAPQVVQTAAFLLSDEASYITGTSVVVAGGMA